MSCRLVFILVFKWERFCFRKLHLSVNLSSCYQMLQRTLLNPTKVGFATVASQGNIFLIGHNFTQRRMFITSSLLILTSRWLTKLYIHFHLSSLWTELWNYNSCQSRCIRHNSVKITAISWICLPFLIDFF